MKQQVKPNFEKEGLIDPSAVTLYFHVSLTHLAIILDESEKNICRQSKPSQERLRQLLSIIHFVTPWCEDEHQAFTWYCEKPIPGFGELTAENIVKKGNYSAVIDYLESISEGGFS